MIKSKINILANLKSKAGISLALLIFSVLASSVILPHKVEAAYNGGNLISNSVFLNSGAMSKEQIQDFLTSKGSGLASKKFKLDCYASDSLERQYYSAISAPCDQTIWASHIIYYSSQVYGINPQVVLSTLQKEQSLVTSPNPTTWQIEHAMGYGCPTTGTCSTSNFFSQIDSGVWVQRYHYERARGNLSWWRPSTSWTCGTAKEFYKPNLYPNQDVSFYDQDGVKYRTHFISNAATSSFYCYTPHAYNNPQGLYGLPAYGTKGRYYTGSYNFVKSFETWFGSTVKETITTVSYDSSTDNSGEMASIGFRLSSKPTANVEIPLAIGSPENARFVSGVNKVIITPANWNNPKANRISIAGLYNPDQQGTIHYKLDLQKPQSNDSAYSGLPPSNYGDVFLVHQETDTSLDVYRLYNSSTGRNVFTASKEEKDSLVSDGWQNKGTAFYYCSAGDSTVLRLSKGNEKKLVVENSAMQSEALNDGFGLENMSFTASRQGSVPIYWFHNSTTDDNFYTTSSSAMSGYSSMGVIFNACAQGVKPVYRMYNTSARSYFFTDSPKERKESQNSWGFTRYEGVGFYVCENGTDVYRLYRKSRNGYAYTTSLTDANSLVSTSGFSNQGVQFELCTDSNRDVYTLYSPYSGVNFYTAYEDEKNDFVNNIGFRNLGVQFESK